MGRKHDLVGSNSGTSSSSSAPPAPKSFLGLSTLNPALKTIGVTFPPKESVVRELDPALIDPSFISDRMEGGQEGHAELVALIRDHGQQVPILVRPHPEAEGRFQIVYGRRRLRAASELGRAVRAMVKTLSDEELVLAQGQENSARSDLSFIERALFAAALEGRGFPRDTIMASLAIDKTTLSRLIKSATDIPGDIIAAIGPAPKAGRDRWVALAGKLKAYKSLAEAYQIVKEQEFGGLPSDERFERVFKGASVTDRPDRSKPSAIKTQDGRTLATVLHEPSGMALKMDKTVEAEFGVHLAKLVPQIYAAWKGGGDA